MLLKTESQRNSHVGSHIVHLESHYSKLDATRMEVEDEVKIAILISSLSNRSEYFAIIASLSTDQKDMVP